MFMACVMHLKCLKHLSSKCLSLASSAAQAFDSNASSPYAHLAIYAACHALQNSSQETVSMNGMKLVQPPAVCCIVMGYAVIKIELVFGLQQVLVMLLQQSTNYNMMTHMKVAGPNHMPLLILFISARKCTNDMCPKL